MHLRRVCSCKLDMITHDLKCKFRGIINEAEMREPDPAYAVWAPGMQNGFGRLIVGEMTFGAENTLFQRIVIGAVQQALTIMIRLYDE